MIAHEPDDTRALWRKRREQRREKQRSLNGLRAAQMGLARREATTPSPNIEVVSHTAVSTHVGCSGWFYWHWRGAFYPEGLAQKRELEYASRQLTSIEINGTYYGSQKPESFRKWREETPGQGRLEGFAGDGFDKLTEHDVVCVVVVENLARRAQRRASSRNMVTNC